MKKSFICTVEENNGKKYYNRIGEILEFSDKEGKPYQKVKLYHIPGQMLSVFEDKPKQNSDNPFGA